jgi:hypothetical protein
MHTHAPFHLHFPSSPLLLHYLTFGQPATAPHPSQLIPHHQVEASGLFHDPKHLEYKGHQLVADALLSLLHLNSSRGSHATGPPTSVEPECRGAGSFPQKSSSTLVGYPRAPQQLDSEHDLGTQCHLWFGGARPRLEHNTSGDGQHRVGQLAIDRGEAWELAGISSGSRRKPGGADSSQAPIASDALPNFDGRDPTPTKLVYQLRERFQSAAGLGKPLTFTFTSAACTELYLGFVENACCLYGVAEVLIDEAFAVRLNASSDAMPCHCLRVAHLTTVKASGAHTVRVALLSPSPDGRHQFRVGGLFWTRCHKV